jgi:hypothetical protein
LPFLFHHFFLVQCFFHLFLFFLIARAQKTASCHHHYCLFSFFLPSASFSSVALTPRHINIQHIHAYRKGYKDTTHVFVARGKSLKSSVPRGTVKQEKKEVKKERRRERNTRRISTNPTPIDCGAQRKGTRSCPLLLHQ